MGKSGFELVSYYLQARNWPHLCYTEWSIHRNFKHFLKIQGIFLTQESNPSLLHCRQILYRLSHPYSGVKKTFSNTSRNLSSVLALKQTGSILWFSRTQVSYYKTQNEYPQFFFHFKTTRFHFHLFHFLKCLS